MYSRLDLSILLESYSITENCSPSTIVMTTRLRLYCSNIHLGSDPNHQICAIFNMHGSNRFHQLPFEASIQIFISLRGNEKLYCIQSMI